MARRPFAQSFRQRIVRQYMVRFHMSLLLMATAATGVLTSKLLLMAGLHSVLFRYPAAVLGAYLAFTGLARLWVAYVLINAVTVKGHSCFSGWSSSSSSSFGIDIGADLLPGGGSSGGGGVSFGGGDSGGAGASDLWDSSASELVAVPTPSGGGGGGGGFSFPSLDLNIDFDDGFWILIVLGALIAVIAGAGGYLIWAAPEILPDLALSALLSSCLTGAAKRAEAQGWMISVLRATFIPLLLILGVTIALALTVHHHCPGADKLTTALACPDQMRPRT
ncbi:MAG TPA: hypothetical protein VGK29_20805 [Paludibaculum sp.]|jgi:hypothetical protein